MKWLAVLYDAHCGICSKLRGWLVQQPTYLPLHLVPLHSPDLALKFPGVMAFAPEEKLVVIADDGSVWRGDGAWITLLWALRSGREHALRLASPKLRPLARKLVTAVSENRLKFSRWLRLRPDTFAAEPDCPEGTCALPSRPNPPPLPVSHRRI